MAATFKVITAEVPHAWHSTSLVRYGEKETDCKANPTAIPTMEGGVETIRPFVDKFVSFASKHPEYTFLVTRIGCGIAGFTDGEIAPLFQNAISLTNIILPKTFADVLEQTK